MIYTKFLESSFYVTSFVLLLSFACSFIDNNSSELLAKYGFLSNAKNAKRFAKECKVFTLSLCPLRYCSIIAEWNLLQYKSQDDKCLDSGT